MTLEKVYNSSLKFLYPLSLRRTFEIVVSEAMGLVGAKYGSLFMESEGKLKRMYASDPILFEVKTRKKGVTYKAYKSEKVVILKNSELMKIHPEFKDIRAGMDVSIPLSYNKITLGVLSVISEKGIEFTKEDIRSLRLFSPLAMLALRKAILYSEIHRALEERDLFVSIASHELKTPLTSIFAYSQMMAKKVKSGVMPSVENMDRLLSEEMRLNKLVSDFLEVNNIRRGKISLDMKKIRISTVLEAAINSFEISDGKHPVELKNKIKDIVVEGDRDKLMQVFLNILNNAGKYSPKGSVIKVNAINEDNEAVVIIKDKGVGIPEKDLPFVFERFYRAENARKTGTGLGLYLVRYVVRKHGGKINIKSKERQGTTVEVRIPKTNE